VSDRVKPSFVILTSGHSDAQPWTSDCPDVKNYKWRPNPVWHRIPVWQQWASKGYAVFALFTKGTSNPRYNAYFVCSSRLGRFSHRVFSWQNWLVSSESCSIWTGTFTDIFTETDRKKTF